MIDTHCHLTYDGLIDRVDEVVAAARAAGVDRMISVGTTPADAARAIKLTERFDNVFATTGVHPGHADEVDNIGPLQSQLREQLNHPRVVALGEMGLDWHYPAPPAPPEAQQRAVFAAQLELMSERPDLPAIIHNREATDDTLAMIHESGVAGDRFVFHCFTGSVDEVERILALGAMVSFTGIVTFGGARSVAEASDRVPWDRLMIETDSPYLTPEPHRKVRPNEPRYVVEVARFLAARRGVTVEDLVERVDANAGRFFGLR